MRSTTLHRLSLAATLGACLVIAGCTDPAPNRAPLAPTEPETAATQELPEPDEAVFNHVDVDSATQIVLMHRASLEVHRTYLSKADIDADVQSVALGLHNRQDIELENLEDLLEVWGQPVPEEGDQTPVDESELRELGQAFGEDASEPYLRLAIGLAESSTLAAEDVLVEGESPELAAIAQEIVNSQGQTQAFMRDMLASLEEEADADSGDDSRDDTDGDGSSDHGSDGDESDGSDSGQDG